MSKRNQTRQLGASAPGPERPKWLFLVIGGLVYVGALLGMWIAHALKLPEPFVVLVDRHPFPVLWSIIGGALFVGLVHLLSGRR